MTTVSDNSGSLALWYFIWVRPEAWESGVELCCKAAQLCLSIVFEHSLLWVEVYRPICYNNDDHTLVSGNLYTKSLYQIYYYS